MIDELADRLASSSRLRQAVEKAPAAKELVRRYVVDGSLDTLVETVKSQCDKGLKVTIDYLPKEIADSHQIGQIADSYNRIIARLADEGLAADSELSLRLSTLGLGRIAPQLTMVLARDITRSAYNAGIRVCLGMEDYDQVDDVLAVHQDLRQDFPDTAVTIQANLRRSLDDLPKLVAQRAKVRICKGSYRAGRDDVWQTNLAIDQAFIYCLRIIMDAGQAPLIATHDPRIIEISEYLINHKSLEGYEFQMLSGIRPLEQRRLVDIGHQVRCYLPFGPNWLHYYIRRTLDRPQNVALFARSLLGRR
uniref:proline dehydrogenase family protein n=1 Tax=Vaginimicrobium propionicum TaxID=1871034 RepID=UPI000970BB8E|nr:proline dehydrogenase family protein [Vaginimicrobium propionicum]